MRKGSKRSGSRPQNTRLSRTPAPSLADCALSTSCTNLFFWIIFPASSSPLLFRLENDLAARVMLNNQTHCPAFGGLTNVFRSCSVWSDRVIVLKAFFTPNLTRQAKPMRTHLFLLSAVCAVLFSHSAAADHRFNSGFTTWGASQFSSNNYRGGFYRPNYSGYYDGGRWNRRHRWGSGRSFVNLSYNGFYPPYRPFGGFGGFGGSDGRALIGGLVIGSLLNQTAANRPATGVVYRNPAVRTRTLISTRQPARSRSVISNSRPQTTLINQNGRRLLRDIEGNCFERTQNTAGEELRVQLAPAECAF